MGASNRSFDASRVRDEDRTPQERSSPAPALPVRKGSMIRRLWSHRGLVVSLVRRQFQLRYRQSAAGVGWAVLPPLVTVGAATIVFDGVANVDTGGVPYPLFAFAALAPWTFFASSLTFGVPSVVQGQQMVSRLAFPRAALPLSLVGVALVDLLIAMLTFVVFVYVTGHTIPLTAFWFPLLMVIELMLVIGVVLTASAMNVFARDVKLGVPLLTQLWLFLTPILYSLRDVPTDLRPWYALNPMTGLVVSFRNVLIFGEPPAFTTLLPSIVGAAILLLLGYWYFSSTEHRFADVI
jgi:lipopolysaccharide transport system permease protein